MQEIINYSLESMEGIERIPGVGEEAPPMRIANPMSSTHEFLRPTLHSGLLATLAANQSYSDGPFRMFEAGRVFLPRTGDLPEEVEVVAAVMVGSRGSESWIDPVGANGMDFFDAKGMVEWLLDRLGINGMAWEQAEHPVYQEGRCATVNASGMVLGYVGEVHPAIREKFDLDSDIVAGFELSLSSLLGALPDSERRFVTLPRFPAATRDLALVVPADVSAGRVTELILRHRLVQSAGLFDIYTGENVAPGTKSLAFHVQFQAADRTLTNEEVSRSLDGLLRNLEREVGATLRNQ